MTVRPATADDEALLRELWVESRAEVPPPVWLPTPGWREVWEALTSAFANGSVQLALDDDGPAGVVWAAPPDRGNARIELLFVRPRARRRGVARALLAACVAELSGRGATSLSLDAPQAVPAARSVARQLGFEEQALAMAAPLEGLSSTLAGRVAGPSRAAVHVQTDDRTSVERALAQFLPRLGSPSLGAEASGWIRISDPVLDGDREAQSRLAGDLSDRLGAVSVALALEEGAVVRFRLYERGRMVDEYLSVPTYYGELPRAEELAMAANPTLVSRLTGAAFADVRRIARTAASPAELPPAEELYEQVARLMGLEP